MKKITKKSKEEEIQRYVLTEMGYVIDTWWDDKGEDRRCFDYEKKDGWKIDFDIYGKNIQMRMRDTIVATSNNKEDLVVGIAKCDGKFPWEEKMTSKSRKSKVKV